MTFRSYHPRRLAVFLVCTTAALILRPSPLPAGAMDYHVRAGDVVEVAIAGMPDLKHRVAVQLDGSLSIPLLGSLPVAGMRVAEMQAKIKTALASKVLRQRLPDGRERPLVLEFHEISASIVEYKPIYVSGDVGKPGEQAFRPLLTARQALAAAGGIEDRTRLQQAGLGVPPAQTFVDLQAEYAAAGINLAKEQLKLWRIRTELGAKEQFDRGTLQASLLSQSAITELLANETLHLDVRRADHAKERHHLELSIREADQHIVLLEAQLLRDAKGADADVEDLDRMKDLYQKGVTALPKLADARRAAMHTSTRQQLTHSQLIVVKRQRTDLARQLERHDDRLRLSLLPELQDAEIRVGIQRARLQGLRERMAPGGARAPEFAGFDRRSPRVSVHRKDRNGTTARMSVNLEFELQPGDVIEVALDDGRNEVSSR